MSESSELQKVLEKILPLLENENVKYHLTGGLVASLYGEPRMTQDLDFVIEIPPDSAFPHHLDSIFGDRYFYNKDTIERAIERKGMFALIDAEYSLKLDFHVGQAVPGELSRSVRKEVYPGVIAPLVAKEDAILSKLVWISKGSERSRRDVAMMLRNPAPIDWPALRERAKELGVADLLEEISKKALPEK
jgi:hypothetical protein